MVTLLEEKGPSLPNQRKDAAGDGEETRSVRYLRSFAQNVARRRSCKIDP